MSANPAELKAALRRQLRLVPITERHTIPAGVEFTLLAHGHRSQRFVQDVYTRAADRLADGHAVLDRLLVIDRVAAGERGVLRGAVPIDEPRPRQVLLRSSDPRRLAAALVGIEAVSGVAIERGDLVVSSLRALDLARALPGVARRADVRLLEVRPLDDSLESTFRELVR